MQENKKKKKRYLYLPTMKNLGRSISNISMINAGLVFFGFLNFISILCKPENFTVTYLDVPNVFEKFWVVMDGEIKQII